MRFPFLTTRTKRAARTVKRTFGARDATGAKPAQAAPSAKAVPVAKAALAPVAKPAHAVLCVFLAILLSFASVPFACADDANAAGVSSAAAAAGVSGSATDESESADGCDADGSDGAIDASADAAEGEEVADDDGAAGVSSGAGASATPDDSAASATDTSSRPAALTSAAQETASEQGESASTPSSVNALASTVAAPAKQGVTSSIALLVIVIGYAGDANGVGAVAYDDIYDWNDAIFTGEGSVSGYYTDMSNGAFTFVPADESSAYGVDGNTNYSDTENDGIVHVTLPEAHGDWKGDFDDSTVASAMLASFARALAAADSSVDFARYDANENGLIETDELAVAFIVAGYEAAADVPTGAASMWSHAWSYSDAGKTAPTLDGVKVDKHIAISEKLGTANDGLIATQQEPTGVLVHELGHYVGLLDLYDTTADDDTIGAWSDYAVGELSLMARGDWASVIASTGTASYIPTALDAWSRVKLGWVTPTVVTKDGVYSVSTQDSKNGYSVLLVPTKRDGEYYLIENRSFTGHDVALASSYPDCENGGIVIWHIDNGVVEAYSLVNGVNAADHRAGIMPLYPALSDSSYEYVTTWKNTVPDLDHPFWTRSLMKDLYAGARWLTLPLYGKGSAADDPTALSSSGIRIEFLSDAGQVMKLRISFSGDQESEKANTQTKKAASHKALREASYAEEDGFASIPQTDDSWPAGLPLALVAAALLMLSARCQLRKCR